jgi:acetyl-CoA synthetase
VNAALQAARDALLDRRTAAESFSWPDVGEHFNWAHDWFDGFARENDRTALVIVEANGTAASYTFAELVDRSDRLGAWLRDQGVRAGDAVVLMLGNQVELWSTMLALIKLGAVMIPTTSAVTPAELRDRIGRGRAGLVICNPGDVAKVQSVGGVRAVLTSEDLRAAEEFPATPLPHPMNASQDRLLLYFTSGTTSRPKLVEHTHVSYPVGHLTSMAWLGLEPGDVHLNISSPGWAKHAYSMFFAPWLAEATVVAFNYERFDPVPLLDVLATHGVTTFCAPPTVWRMLIKADLGRGPGTLRELLSAGEPLNAEVVERIRAAWGRTIREGYGQTETTIVVGNMPGAVVRPGSMGRSLPGAGVVLVDPATGEPHPSEGEICLDLSRSPLGLMTGYQDDELRNAEAMAGGYYHTGDLASADAEGYLTFIGRVDDVFKSSDYKVSPFELESVLLEHPAVLEAAVVPVPDPVRLTVPKAYVSLAPGHLADQATADDLFRYARANLPAYLRIRRLEFASELPKTTSGKIRRAELRARESKAEATPLSRSAVEYSDPGSGRTPSTGAETM